MADSRDWGPIVELGPGEPPTYPVGILPTWMRRHVRSVTEACQVPSDLPFLLSLTGLSVGAANKARAKIREGYTEPAHLWTAVVLPPASRKSPVFRHMTHPLMEWEKERAEEIRPERRRKHDRKEVAEKALKNAKRNAAKAGSQKEIGEQQQRIKEARERLEKIEVPSVPRLVASDVTSEKLAKLMADHHGRIAVLAPEGDIFRIMGGRYSGDINIDHYKRGWTGDEPIRDDRVGRDGTHVPRPALTLGITVQPSVLDTLEEKDSFRGEGLLGRFIYAAPDSGIGSRKTGSDVPGLDPEAAETYRRNLRMLLESKPRAVNPDGTFQPHEIALSDLALAARDEFAAEVESMVGPGGRLEGVRDWGGKLLGHTTRVAILLQAAQQVGKGDDPWEGPVSDRAMTGAIQVGRASIDHALRVFDRLEMEPKVRLAGYVLRRLRDLDKEERTVRELSRACQGKTELENTDELRTVLSILETHNYVRVEEPRNVGPGRPPSPRIVLHPDATPKTDRIDGTKLSYAGKNDSDNSVNAERAGKPHDHAERRMAWEAF